MSKTTKYALESILQLYAKTRGNGHSLAFEQSIELALKEKPVLAFVGNSQYREQVIQKFKGSKHQLYVVRVQDIGHYTVAAINTSTLKPIILFDNYAIQILMEGATEEIQKLDAARNAFAALGAVLKQER